MAGASVFAASAEELAALARRPGRVTEEPGAQLGPRLRGASVARAAIDWAATMKYVLFYESAEDVASTAPLHFAAHRARWAQFHDLGSLLLVGPFSDQRGAMAVFTTNEAAEEFAKGDPFVVHGVVRSWSIREWNEALTEP